MNRLLACALLALPAFPAGVRVLFDPSTPETGPFPTDALTLADARQRTGRRINLPLPDCRTEPSTCAERTLLNQYDGFDPAQRAAIRFSGAIQPETLRNGLVFVWLDSLAPREFNLGAAGTTSPGNEFVYDPATNTAYARPDQIFDQMRRYAIVVTDAVRDAAGDPVEADAAFTACSDGSASSVYCRDLSQQMPALRAAVRNGRIVAASVYTTMAVTSFMEGARAVLQTSALNFARLPGKAIFEARNIRQIDFRRQVATRGDNRFVEQAFPAPPGLLAQVGIGKAVFGTYRSPRFLDARQLIPTTPSGEPVTLPAQSDAISFHAFLPATPPPAGGYPVVIAGHGFGDDRFGMPSVLAAGMVSAGYAVIAINAVGHGYGPESTVRITENDGTVTELPAGGRAVDILGSGALENAAGCVAIYPDSPTYLRDCLRQTVLDTAQLVRLIRSGVDLDGAGRATFDGTRIAYLGQSMGAFFGTALLAIEPEVRVGVLNVGGDSFVFTGRFSAGFRPLINAYCAGRIPRLSNAEGSCADNYPLRYEPVRVNNQAGATQRQNLFETIKWLEAPASSGNYAPHLKSATLPGVPIKRVFFQAAEGDQTVPGPVWTGLIRHANMRDSASVYRHDFARAAVPAISANPHAYLVWGLLGSNTAEQAVGLGALGEAAGFILSNGTAVPDVNPLVQPLFNNSVFGVPGNLFDRLPIP